MESISFFAKDTAFGRSLNLADFGIELDGK